MNIYFCQDTQQSTPYRYHGIDSTATVLWMRILIPWKVRKLVQRHNQYMTKLDLNLGHGLFLFCFLIFTMLCWFLLYRNTNQPWVYTFSPSWASLSLPPLIPVGCHRAPDWVTEQLPITCFTHGGVYMLMVLSQFISPSPSPTVSTRLSSTSLSLEMPCK